MQFFLDKYGHAFTWLGLVSTFTFFLSLLIIPLLICKLDDTFFLNLHQKQNNLDQHPLLSILLRIPRYLLGAILLQAGFIMIFLPGQGLLTIFLGVSLLDFPGKQKAIKLIHFHLIQNSLNWIRKKGSRSPFHFP